MSPRRSAGMHGSPMDGVPEYRPRTSPPKPVPEPQVAAPLSRSRHPAPKVLIGEVAAPKGKQIAAERDAFRAFMRRHGLQPGQWARDAGVARAEVLAFLAGHAGSISRESLEKLAAAAKAAPGDLLRE